MKLSYKSHTSCDGDYLIVCDAEPNWFERLFGARKSERKFIGQCSVWHHYPSFRRCSFGDEGFMSEVATEIRFRERSSALLRKT